MKDKLNIQIKTPAGRICHATEAYNIATKKVDVHVLHKVDNDHRVHAREEYHESDTPEIKGLYLTIALLRIDGFTEKNHAG